MVRYGAVIVFTEGIDKEHAEYLLNQMVRDGRIEDPGCPDHVYNNGKTRIPGHKGVHEFNDSDGTGPVWYLP